MGVLSPSTLRGMAQALGIEADGLYSKGAARNSDRRLVDLYDDSARVLRRLADELEYRDDRR